LVRAVISTPASNAALRTVVDTWHTPPARPVVTSPFTITGATRNPFAAVEDAHGRDRQHEEGEASAHAAMVMGAPAASGTKP
jgi:hypothetical protein